MNRMYIWVVLLILSGGKSLKNVNMNGISKTYIEKNILESTALKNKAFRDQQRLKKRQKPRSQI